MPFYLCHALRVLRDGRERGRLVQQGALRRREARLLRLLGLVGAFVLNVPAGARRLGVALRQELLLLGACEHA